MSTNGFDSPPTPSKDMLKTIELANDISTLIDGTTTEPNIELNKCINQASKQVAVHVEAMATIYNTILIIDDPNFLDVLLIQSAGESLYLYICRLKMSLSLTFHLV
jgi:hypothetical protein